ncbi:MAG: NAD-dependent epimerase/dehydratase family protein [Prevotella sp.]|nr:NAD-dependent epimerase/dehydratase family protein [Prevotella sp.]
MKIILTGATGYVGEGALLELLKIDEVEKVLSVSRKSTGVSHEKLEEYIVADFMTLKKDDAHFKGYDAVFFIAGITSVGTPKDVYVRISQEIPLHFADIMPDKEQMTYIYLSGAGTSPTGKQFWQQVKSKTEAEIQTKGFKRTFGFRPAIMKWSKGQKHIQTMQYLFMPFYPLFRIFGLANSMEEIARSMLTLTCAGYNKFEISPKDIRMLAKSRLM